MRASARLLRDRQGVVGSPVDANQFMDEKWSTKKKKKGRCLRSLCPRNDAEQALQKAFKKGHPEVLACMPRTCLHESAGLNPLQVQRGGPCGAASRSSKQDSRCWKPEQSHVTHTLNFNCFFPPFTSPTQRLLKC